MAGSIWRSPVLSRAVIISVGACVAMFVLSFVISQFVSDDDQRIFRTLNVTTLIAGLWLFLIVVGQIAFAWMRTR